jgi:hypothetical protein
MRGKLLFILIIYFAGFFSAIYVLTPGSEDPTASLNNTREFAINIDGQEKIVQAKDIAVKVGAGMRQFLCFAGEKASKVSEIIRARLDEENMN